MFNANSFLSFFINFESKLHQTSAKEFSLDEIKAVLKSLGHPEKTLKIVHVAGTKGKGSTCAMIAAILKESGFSVGLYTSPHLYSLNERIRILKPGQSSCAISGRKIFSDSITDQSLSGLIRRHRSAIEKVHRASSRGLTFFEVLTVLALCHFAERKVDYVVLETGLGGRLDATNAVDSIAAVITSVSLDHQNILGTTLRKIAAEKAGIIKAPAQKVIVAPQKKEAKHVILQRCQTIGAVPVCVKQKDVDRLKPFRLSLQGSYQVINAAVAVKAVESLGLKISPRITRSALRTVFWPGRFEVISRFPTMILDGAHNEHSIKVLIKTLEETYPRRKKIFVFGASQDKNIAAMLKGIAGSEECVLLTKFDHPRAAGFDVKKVKKIFRPGREVAVFDRPMEALRKAKEFCKGDKMIIVTGSLFLVAQVRQMMEAGCTPIKD